MANIPTVTSDNFSLQSTQNIILPHETTDEAIRRYILSSCSRSLMETANYRNWLIEASKRYESLRSTRSLDHDDPIKPWRRSSNVGMPLESITGEALVPRFNAATSDSEPIYRIQIHNDQLKEFEEDATNWYHELYTITMRIREIRDATYRNLVIDGDSIEEAVWEERHQQTSKTVVILQDAKFEILTDENGIPRIFQANIPDSVIPDDPLTGKKFKKIQVQRKGNKRIYDGPKVINWRINECIWPYDATTPEINNLDWFAVQMWKSPSWFKTREGDPIQGKLKNIDQLLLRFKHGIPSHLNTAEEQQLTRGVLFPRDRNKILVWRFFGLFDVDNDGIDEEIMAMVSPMERLLLGWRLTSFSERPFFHYQLFKMPGRFTGRGLPHISKGIRDIVDFKINQSNNRESIYGNPPVLYETNSGFDPAIHQFGTGARWGPLNEGGINKIRALELPKSQEQLTIDFINFYMAILQRLTGITDFNLGGPRESAAPNVKTATGTMTVVNEGNIKFSDFIKSFQMTSERIAEFIDREFFQEGLIAEDNISMLSKVQVPIEVIQATKTIRATGNSSTMNRKIIQDISLMILDRFSADSLLQNFPQIQRQIRQAVLDAFDQSIQLPDVEEIQASQTKQLAQAIQQMPDEEKTKIFAGIVRNELEQSGIIDGQVSNRTNGQSTPVA